jgi:LPS-assembly protein
MRRSFLPIVFLLCCAIWPAAAAAQNPLSNCKSSLVEKERFSYPLVEGSTTVHEGIMSGHVRILCDGSTLQAEEIRWRDDSPMVYASGDVYFEQEGTQISAQRAQMNRDTHLGTFFDASGWMDLMAEKADRTLFGTQEPYVIFWADEIEKTNDHTYVLTHGGFTSCRQPTPRWDMSSSKLTLVPGKHAILKNMVLRVKDVPLFYLPTLYYPINHEDRATGILLPTYGNSSYRGLTLSNAFFWAINRSQDATFYHDYYSKTGQGVGGEYRYVGDAGSAGNGRIFMVDEHAQFADDGVTLLRDAHRSFDIRGNLNQSLGHGIRANGRVNYFTDITTQQVYQQNIADYTTRSRSIGGTISGGTGRYRMSGQYDQTDYFNGDQPAVRTGSTPLGNFSIGEKPIGRTPIYFSGSIAGGHLVRQNNIDDPLTNQSLWRIDGGPRISAPISQLPALTVTTSAALHYTYWTKSIDPVLGQVSVPITRQVMDLQARIVGPVFSRIWHTPNNGYAEGFKHLIEPSLTLSWLSPFDESTRIVQLDGVDTLVTGTTQMVYGWTSRLLAKRRTGAPAGGSEATGIVREILTVDMRQTYYTNALAAKYDPEYQSSFAGLYNYQVPPSPFSPVQVSAIARPTETTSAQFRMEYDTRFNAVRTYSASGSLDQSIADITASWSKRQVIPGLPEFADPASADHFLGATANIHDRDNHFGGTYMFNYDVLRDYFLQRRYRVYYNSQCCGVAFDLQSVDLSHFSGLSGLSGDRRMSISFTLAGIGTFSNPLGSFGGAR